ncbi:MAG: hypothetical protein GF307_00765 [candidate division Zixibacteria bacterium]|nr:hypothetical protein [candidate division Zixibacteria bacterium]
MDQYMEQLMPLLSDIAKIANGEGDGNSRINVEEAIKQIDQSGGQLWEPVHQIWDGERDADKLTADLDEASTRLVMYILRLIEVIPKINETMAELPDNIREAVESGDNQKVMSELNNLPEGERAEIIEKFRAIGLGQR